MALLHYKVLTHLARIYGLWWCTDIFSYHQLAFIAYCKLSWLGRKRRVQNHLKDIAIEKCVCWGPVLSPLTAKNASPLVSATHCNEHKRFFH